MLAYCQFDFVRLHTEKIPETVKDVNKKRLQYTRQFERLKHTIPYRWIGYNICNNVR